MPAIRACKNKFIIKKQTKHKWETISSMVVLSNFDQDNREDTCLQTLICQPQEQRPFVLTANKSLVGTLMTIGDVNDIFPILRSCKKKSSYGSEKVTR